MLTFFYECETKAMCRLDNKGREMARVQQSGDTINVHQIDSKGRRLKKIKSEKKDNWNWNIRCACSIPNSILPSSLSPPKQNGSIYRPASIGLHSSTHSVNIIHNHFE